MSTYFSNKAVCRRLLVGATKSLLLLCMIVALAFLPGRANATLLITNDLIDPTTGGEIASGNGQLDLILLGFSGGGGVTSNAAGSFNGDNANTDMPTGGGTSVVESYITSMGEIRDFYELTFPDGQGGSLVNQMVLFVDLNETGQVNHITLNDLQILIDYADFPGIDTRNDPAGNDITSAVQNSTGSGFTGGTVLAKLDPSIAPKALALNVQGAGFADYSIATGVNPFGGAYSDNTRVLFFWSSTDHDDGGDKVFLSGSFTGIPEPATLSLLALGGLLTRRRK